MASPRVRVMIVDDHDMVRSGLAILLEAFDDLSLVGIAENGAEAVQLCDKIETDVVLMDMVMPEMDGIAAARAIRQRHPQVQVVALVGFGNEGMLDGMMKAGAAGHVLKNASIDHIAAAIRAAHAQSQAAEACL